jgi:transketolase C-terminal domain/subunit
MSGDLGDDFAIISCGTIASECDEAIKILSAKGIRGKHISLTLVSPLPVEEIMKACGNSRKIYTVEEGVVSGGMGEAICGLISAVDPSYNVKVFAVEDPMIRAGSVKQQLEDARLDAKSIAERISSDV